MRGVIPIVHHPNYRAQPGDPSFPLNKFNHLARILVEDGLVAADGFHQPDGPAAPELLQGAHDADYVAAVLDFALPPEAVRRIGIPMNEAVVRRTRTSTAGTLLAGRLALAHGVACNTAGGSHHAARDHGAGYCIFNDVAVASSRLLAEGEVDRVLVVDLDVHQGDGTARIFADDPRVFTFSMHARKNFPARKAVSDLDIELEDGTDDEAYLGALQDVLPGLVESHRPDLIFYVAGVDPFVEDRLGRLALSEEGLFRRDSFVLSTALRSGTPVAGVLGGGYDKDLERLARRHSTLHRAATAAARASA
jgi:acetoin utilization deacetylase AcuC-like enzyme